MSLSENSAGSLLKFMVRLLKTFGVKFSDDSADIAPVRVGIKRTGYMSKWTYFNEESDPNIVGLDNELMAKLDMARAKTIEFDPDKKGVIFTVTCGKRTEGQNIKCQGVHDSAHLKGLAVDLHAPDHHYRGLMVRALYAVGFVRVGVYRDSNGNATHVHADIDPSLPQDVLWDGVSH